MPRTSDRRRAVRSPIAIPIQLTLRGRSYHARTRDVSAEGLAVILNGPAPLRIGDRVEFLLALEHVEAGDIVLLEGNAVVVRTAWERDRILAIKPDWLLTTTGDMAVATLDSRHP